MRNLVLLSHPESAQIIIFFDHIETIVQRSHIHDFFDIIRRVQNEFSTSLSIVLVGSVSEIELGQKLNRENQTNFLADSRSIEIRDLEAIDVQAAIDEPSHKFHCLRERFENCQDGLRKVIEVTRGHLFLTTKLLSEIAEQRQRIWNGDEDGRIESLVRTKIIERKDNIEHLLMIKRRLLADDGQLLIVYEKYYDQFHETGLRKENIQNLELEKHLIQRLVFLGLIKDRGIEGLLIHNSIYKKVFQLEWLRPGTSSEAPQYSDSVPPFSGLPSASPPSQAEPGPSPASSDGSGETPPSWFSPLIDFIKASLEKLKVISNAVGLGWVVSILAWIFEHLTVQHLWQFCKGCFRLTKRLWRRVIRRGSNPNRSSPSPGNPRNSWGRRLLNPTTIVIATLTTILLLAFYIALPWGINQGINKLGQNAEKAIELLQEGDQIKALETAIQEGGTIEYLQSEINKKIPEALRNSFSIHLPTTARFALQRILNTITVQDQIGSGYKSVSSITFSDDGRWIAASGNEKKDGIVTVWSRQGKVVKQWYAEQGSVTDLSFSRGGQFLATVGRSGGGAVKIKIWDLQAESKNGSNVPALRGEDDISKGKVKRGEWFLSVSFNPSDDKVAASDKSGKVHLWNINSAQNKELLEKQPDPLSHDKEVTGLSFYPNQDKNYLATASRDGFVRVWNLDRNSVDLVKKSEVGALSQITFNTTGTLIAVGGQNGVELFQMPNHLEIGESLTSVAVFKPDSPIQDVSFSKPFSQGSLLAAAGNAGTFKLWYLPKQNGNSAAIDVKSLEVKSGVYKQSDIRTLSFNLASDEGAPELLLAGNNSLIQVWNFKHLINSLTDSSRNVYPGESVREISGRSSEGEEVVAAVIMGNENGKGKAYALRSQGDVCNGLGIGSKYGSVTSVMFIPGSKKIATAHEDGRIYFWDAQQCDRTTSDEVLSTQQRQISSLAFDPNQETIAVANQDGIKFWRYLEQRQTQNSITVGGQTVRRLLYNKSGDHLLALMTNRTDSDGKDVDGKVSLWKVEKDKVKENSEKSLNPGMAGGIDDARFTPDGRHIAAVSSEDKKVAFWNLEWKLLGSIKLDQAVKSQGATRLSFSPDGNLLAVGEVGGAVTIWDVSGIKWDEVGESEQFWKNRKIATFEVQTGADQNSITSLTFFRNNYVLAGRKDGTVNLLPISELGDLLKSGCTWLGNYRDRSKVIKEACDKILPRS